MHAQLEELWIDAMEMKVGEQITTYLRKNHPEYQEIEARQKKLIEDYPMLWKVVDGDGTVTLNEKEHCALKEYLSNQDDMERLEKEYHYYYGQSHVFSYGRMLKSIQREINPDGDVARKRKLADMLIEARTSEAEMDFLKEDEEYQKRRKESLRQEGILKAMNLPEDIKNQIDLLTCSINDHWSRYAELVYHQSDVEEVIIATNSSLEGETTAMYISKLIKPTGIKVTRIASGVPVGGDLEYIDEVTLLRALEGRTEL